MNFVQFVHQVRDSLWQHPVRLCDIRRKAEVIEQAGADRFKRFVLGEVTSTVNLYYPLPELIEHYRRQQEVYREHVRNGDIDDSTEGHVLVGDIFGLCDWWLPRDGVRYAYGDVRLLRPLIGEVLIAVADRPRMPYPEKAAQLGEWYEELAPGGSLYPSEEHLDYVRRFEAFAEDIVWDSQGRDYITIVNFPAPPNPPPPTEWWCTQHLLPAE